jgi:hypothetical protein
MSKLSTMLRRPGMPTICSKISRGFSSSHDGNDGKATHTWYVIIYCLILKNHYILYLYTRWTHTLLGNMVAIIGWNPEGGKCSFSLLFLNLLSKTCLRPQVCVDTSNSCESNMKRTELNHVLPFLSPIEPLSCQSHGCQLCLQPSFGTVDRHYIAGLNLFPWLKATCPPNGIRDPKWSSTSPFRCNMVGCKVKKNYVTRKRTKKRMVPGRLRLQCIWWQPGPWWSDVFH